LARLNRLLIVPIAGGKRETPFESCILRTPFFWSPSDRQLESIAREWAMFQTEIKNGSAAELTPASQTSFIHVRPHSRNRADTDMAPIVGPVVKKSFWLNQDFLAALISEDRSSA